MAVRFFSQNISFKLKNQRRIANWITSVVELEKDSVVDLNIIFVSDSALLQINQNYLKHDTLTDIITFDNRDDSDGGLVGDVFISVKRVRENARLLGISSDHELCRVIIHGVLHLLGYSDKSHKQKSQMRKKEDTYLSLLEIKP